jgi:hypothetical protein
MVKKLAAVEITVVLLPLRVVVVDIKENIV